MILSENAVALIQENLSGQIQRLLGAGCDEDIVCRALDSPLARLRREGFAQRWTKIMQPAQLLSARRIASPQTANFDLRIALLSIRIQHHGYPSRS